MILRKPVLRKERALLEFYLIVSLYRDSVITMVTRDSRVFVPLSLSNDCDPAFLLIVVLVLFILLHWTHHAGTWPVVVAQHTTLPPVAINGKDQFEVQTMLAVGTCSH